MGRVLLSVAEFNPAKIGRSRTSDGPVRWEHLRLHQRSDERSGGLAFEADYDRMVRAGFRKGEVGEYRMHIDFDALQECLIMLRCLTRMPYLALSNCDFPMLRFSSLRFSTLISALSQLAKYT